MDCIKKIKIGETTDSPRAYADYLMAWMKAEGLIPRTLEEKILCRKSHIWTWMRGKHIPTEKNALFIDNLSNGAVPYQQATIEREARFAVVVKTRQTQVIKRQSMKALLIAEQAAHVIGTKPSTATLNFTGQNIIERPHIHRINATIYNGEHVGGGSSRMCEEL